MTDETKAVVMAEDEAGRRRKAAILKAVGLDTVPVEQRELALAIANRYDLDLMLKHLVLIDGRPYITRDALLWVAHRSGHFDGIQTTEPTIKDFPGLGQCWWSETTVWRDDMSHPFVYGGRYPVAGQNKKYGPEMAIKVSECMSLRRAFNVSAPTVEERWSEMAEDAVLNAQDAPGAPKDLKSLVAAKVDALAPEAPHEYVDSQGRNLCDVCDKYLGAKVHVPPPVPAPLEDEDMAEAMKGTPEEVAQGEAAVQRALAAYHQRLEDEDPAESKVTMKAPPKTPTDSSAMVKDTKAAPPITDAEAAICDAASPYNDWEKCDQLRGHPGLHRVNNSTWADAVK